MITKTVACAFLALCTPTYLYGQAQIRFVNATPAELQSVVISVDDARVSEVAFGRSTTRMAISDGARRIKVSTTTEQGSVTLVEKTLTFAPGKYYTVFLWGTLVPSSYDIASAEDAEQGMTGHLQARYALLSKGIIVDGNTYRPRLVAYCEGLSPLSIEGDSFKDTPYRETSHPANWNGGPCRVAIEIDMVNARGQQVSVPVWQDISNYYFTPHTNYTFISVGTNASSLVVLREVDNK